MDCIDCVEATARLHLYIDRELNADEVEIVQQHLIECPHCTYRFRFDMCLKRLIHKRCTIEHAPIHLREVVMRIAHAPLGESIDIEPDLVREIKADMENHD